MALPSHDKSHLFLGHMRTGTAILLTATLVAVVVAVTLQLFVNR
jgi:hypothetical protein